MQGLEAGLETKDSSAPEQVPFGLMVRQQNWGWSLTPLDARSRSGGSRMLQVSAALSGGVLWGQPPAAVRSQASAKLKTTQQTSIRTSI